MSKYVEDKLKEIEQYSTTGDPLTDIAIIKGMANKLRNAMPTIDEGWVSVDDKRPPYMEFILTWDGVNMVYRCLSKGHDIMPLDEFKARTKITHWMIPQPPTK